MVFSQTSGIGEAIKGLVSLMLAKSTLASALSLDSKLDFILGIKQILSYPKEYLISNMFIPLKKNYNR